MSGCQKYDFLRGVCDHKKEIIMEKSKGQIQIGLGVIAAGAFLIGSLTFAVNAYLKSGEAIEKVFAVEGDIKSINTEIKNISKILDAWQQQQIKDNKISKDGTK